MKIYNTAERKKTEFKPIRDKKVGIYSCGPTVYWNQHLGNMYAYLSWDVLIRTLKYLGFETKWVMNITDVGHLTSDGDTGEDKMEKGAKKEGLTVWEVAKKYEGQFMESVRLLNITNPDVICRATEHISDQIELAKRIEANGYAYMTDVGLRFDTGKFADYGKFANLRLEQMADSGRLDADPKKKNQADFLLWIVNQPNHIMQWDSPWGRGFPGWHIECTAMSTRYLGEEFDIHTGGIDHIPVHHTNEIAQGYGAFGHQTARYWMHNAWVVGKGGQKMSKSLGNVFTAQELAEMGINPLAYRYLFLTTHYRKGMEFSLESLAAARKPYERLKQLMADWPEGGEIDADFSKRFVELISDDLMMPEVVALVWEVTRSNLSSEDKRSTILEMDRVLGLDLERPEEAVSGDVVELANARWAVKKKGDWSEADRLRKLIQEKGYIIEDRADGFKLKRDQTVKVSEKGETNEGR